MKDETGKAKTERPLAVGDRLRVHRPAWKDAIGCEYAPGRHHGETGTIIGIDSDMIGVVFSENTMTYWFFIHELRREKVSA